VIAFLINAAGDDDDLAHALTRLMLAVELRERSREARQWLAEVVDHRRASPRARLSPCPYHWEHPPLGYTKVRDETPR
jgi:hypothetical protein